MLLTLSWTLPLAGAILLALIGNGDGKSDAMIRWTAPAGYCFTFTRPACGLRRSS